MTDVVVGCIVLPLDLRIMKKDNKNPKQSLPCYIEDALGFKPYIWNNKGGIKKLAIQLALGECDRHSFLDCPLD